MRHMLTTAGLILAGLAVTGLAGTGPAMAQDKPAPGQIAQIDEALKNMNCEVDADNIEIDGAAYDLDDVMCADGQYDMKLDASFKVMERRKE